MQLTWLPQRHRGAGVVARTGLQAVEQASHKLAILLQKHKWSELAHRLQLINLTIQCHSETASHLSAAGAASVVSGILHHYQLAPPATSDALCASTLELLLRLLRTDGRTLPFVSTLEVLSIMLQVLESGASQGLAARRTAAAIILHLAQHSRGCNAALLSAGAAHVMGGVLSDLPSLCDLDLVQAVLWTVCSMRLDPSTLSTASISLPMDSSFTRASTPAPSHPKAPGLSRSSLPASRSAAPTLGASGLSRLSIDPASNAAAASSSGAPGLSRFSAHPAPGAQTPTFGPKSSFRLRPQLSTSLGGQLQPQPDAGLDLGPLPLSSLQLLPAVAPLLHAYRLPGPQYSGHLLGLVVRSLHVLLAGDVDDECKALLRGHGVVEALVGLIQAEVAGRGKGGAAPGGPGRAGAWQGQEQEPAQRRLPCHPLPDSDDEAGGGRAQERVTPWQRLLAALLLLPGASAPQPDAGTGPSGGPPPQLAPAPSLLPSYSVLLPLLRLPPSALVPLDLEAAPSPLCDRSPSPSTRTSGPPTSPAPPTGPVALSPVKEAVALLRALLSDSPSDQSLAVAAGVIPPLIQLVREGDMEEAWAAAEVLGSLRPSFGVQLLEGGAVEALATLLREAADTLHLVTVQRQLRQARAGGEAGAAALAAPSPVEPAQQHQAHHGAHDAHRVHLVGRQNPFSFCSGSSSCMQAAGHGAASFCDLCIPSAALKALLRLLDPSPLPPGDGHTPSATHTDGATTTNPAASGGQGDLVERFVTAGGIYTLFLLLHHEDTAGVTQSKLASSLISFLNQILAKRPNAQDEVRQVGGLPILTSVLQGLMKPGVTDIYQLRVSVCMVLKALLQGNAANRILARENGLFTPLMDLLRLALQQPARSSSGGRAATGTAAAAALANMSLLDAEEQVALAAMDTLAASVPGSSGNQDALVSNGIAKLLSDLLASAHYTPAMYASALRLTAAMCESPNAVQRSAMGSAMLQHATALVDSTQSWGEVAGGYCTLLLQLLRHAPQEAKGRILAAGALRILLHTLNQRPAGRSTDVASSVLQLLVANDVDLQNEVASRGGGLQSCYELISCWHGVLTHSMFRLLSALALGNTFVKNIVRQGGFLPLLLAVMRGCALSDPPTAILSAQALTSLVKSNHANQSALAEQGGIDTLAELIHVVVVSPVLVAAAPAAAGLRTATDAAALSAEQLQQQQLQWGQRNPMYDRDSMDGASSLSPGASQLLLSPGASSQLLSPRASGLPRSPVASALFPAAAGGSGGGAGAEAAEAEAGLGALERAAERRDMLEALLRLLGAAAEFHAANQQLVGESGCLAVLMHFLRCATSLPDMDQRLAKARLAPALGAACSALSRLLQDCPENQLRLIEGSRVSVEGPGESLRLVLSKLLSINDPSIALEAARSLEYVTLGYDNSPELEEEAVRALVKVLHSKAGPGRQVLAGSKGGSFSSAAGPAAVPAPEPVPVSTVREASGLLQRVMEACNLVLAEAGGAPVEVPGLEAAAAGAGKGGRKKPPASAALAAAAAARKQQAPAPSVVPATPPPAPPPLVIQPLAAIPASFSSPIRGDGGTNSPKTPTLAASRSPLEGQDDPSTSGSAATQQWQQLIGRSAPAFQAVAAGISDGPWKPCMLQIAWLLFLLSVKSRLNLELLGRLLRTTLLPLIQQLENAEASHALLMHALAQQQQQHQNGVGSREGSRQLLGSSNSTGPLPVSTSALESVASFKGGLAPGSRPAQLLLSPLGQAAGSPTATSSPGRLGAGDSPFARHNAALSPRALKQISEEARHGGDRWGTPVGGEDPAAGGAAYGGNGAPPLSPTSVSRRLTSDDDDWELAMIRQEVALMARTGAGTSAARL